MIMMKRVATTSLRCIYNNNNRCMHYIRCRLYSNNNNNDNDDDKPNVLEPDMIHDGEDGINALFRRNLDDDAAKVPPVPPPYEANEIPEFMYAEESAKTEAELYERVEAGEYVDFPEDKHIDIRNPITHTNPEELDGRYEDTIDPRFFKHKTSDDGKEEYTEGPMVEQRPHKGTYLYRTKPDNQGPPQFKHSYDPYASPKEIREYYINLLKDARDNWSPERQAQFQQNTGVDVMDPNAESKLLNEIDEFIPKEQYFPEDIEAPYEPFGDLYAKQTHDDYRPKKPDSYGSVVKSNESATQQQQHVENTADDDVEVDEYQIKAELKLIRHMLTIAGIGEYADKFESMKHFLSLRREQLKFDLGIPTKARKKVRDIATQFEMRQLLHKYADDEFRELKHRQSTDPYDPRWIQKYRNKFIQEANESKQQEVENTE